MYTIGQTLWIIASGTKTIEPLVVCAKQTNEDSSGKSVQHMCKTFENETIPLESHLEKKLAVGVFESVEEAESHLMNLATDMVKKLAMTAREKSFSMQDKRENKSMESIEQDISTELSDISMIELPDGTKARVNLPPEML